MHWAADRSQLHVAEVLIKAGLDPLIPGRVIYNTSALIGLSLKMVMLIVGHCN